MKKVVLIFISLALVLFYACSNSDNDGSKEVKPNPGKKIFQKNCLTCHGADGKMGLNGAKDLSISQLSLDERIVQIKKGKNAMQAFEGVLKDEEIKLVAEYTLSLKKNNE